MIRFNGKGINLNNIKQVRVDGKTVYSSAVPDLCFKANTGGSTVGYTIKGSLSLGMQYSTNGRTWMNWDGSNITLPNVGSKIYVRNTQNTLSRGWDNLLTFTMSGSIAASGNVNSLINYSTVSDYCFAYLFKNCKVLTTAPEMQSTTVKRYCYGYMYYGCDALTEPPSILPAMSLDEGCYSDMFYKCTSLRKAPQLPATYLNGSYCYYEMFMYCSSLKISESTGTAFMRYTDVGGSAPVSNMFNRTGGTYTGNPYSRKTYYYY